MATSKPLSYMTKPILEEAKRLLDFYTSDDFRQQAGADTTFELHRFEVRPAQPEREGSVEFDAPEGSYIISAEIVEVSGPLAERTGDHDEGQLLGDDGTVLLSWADGVVDDRPKAPIKEETVPDDGRRRFEETPAQHMKRTHDAAQLAIEAADARHPELDERPGFVMRASSEAVIALRAHLSAVNKTLEAYENLTNAADERQTAKEKAHG